MKKVLLTSAVLMMSNFTYASDMVALLLPENVNPRWEKQDAYFFKQYMKEISPDVRVEVFNANNSTQTQQSQAEQALTRGAKVLIVAPIDGEAAAVIAETAASDNVPTIAYDRMIHSEYSDYWIQSDMVKVGQAQAQHVVDSTEKGSTLVLLKGSPTDSGAQDMYAGQMKVLKPLFASGERVNGYENWTQGWDVALARRSMDQALTKLDNNVDGVVSSNDGNASAAIAALEEQSLIGIPVSGLDGTPQALQLILLDKQTQSVWRPFNEMAKLAAQLTVSLMNDDGKAKQLVSKKVMNKANHEMNFIEVPYKEIKSVQDVEFVINHDSSISKADVCTAVTSQTSYCQG